MKGSGLFKKFNLQWSMEGPIESMMELSEELKCYALKNRLVFLLFFIISVVLLSVISLLAQSWNFYIDLLGGLDRGEIIWLIGSMMGTIVLIAFPLFLLLIIIQTYRFQDVLTSRFLGVDDFWSGEKLDDDSVVDDGEGFNPLTASLSFTEDVGVEIPQLINQLRYSALLVLMVSLIILLDFILDLGFGFSEIGVIAGNDIEYFMRIVELVMGLFGLFSWLVLWKLSDFFDYFRLKYEIIRSVNEMGPMYIPEGEGVVERYKRYLLDRDAYLYGVDGLDGDEDFDLKFAGDEYALFVRKIDPDDLDESAFNRFKRDVESRLAEKPYFLRAVLLTKEEDELVELSDDFVEHLDENPIELRKGPGGGNMYTHIQVVIDSGGTYSVYPFLPESFGG